MNKAYVFIDAGHIHYQLFEKWRINYQKLIDYFRTSEYTIIGVYYYEGMPTELSYSSKHQGTLFEDFFIAKENKKKYFELLRSFGFVVRHKPVHRIFDQTAQHYKFKCNFDVEMTIDIVETALVKEVDTFIICSGDGDLTKLVKYLKSKWKKVVIVGIKHSISGGLIETAHEIIFLDNLRDEIELR